MKLWKRKARAQSGQAAIEFIVVVIVLFFFLFFYLGLAIALVVANYVEYATFMTARTYKSGYFTQESQEKFAREVWSYYMEDVTGILENPRLEFTMVDPSDPQTAGAVTTYDIPIFYMPPLFILGDAPPSRIRLQAEVYLGRDPPYQECINFFDRFSSKFGLGIQGTGLMGQMADNGC